MVQVPHSCTNDEPSHVITGTYSTGIIDDKGIVVNRFHTIDQVPYDHAITARGASTYPCATLVKGHTSQIIIKIRHDCWFTSQVIDLAFTNEK